jgi:hypothetical protein
LLEWVFEVFAWQDSDVPFATTFMMNPEKK